jgi:outer membrane lipoprotein-sorting protein
MKKSKTNKNNKSRKVRFSKTKILPKKIKVYSFKPRMYRMKINISKRNKNKNLKTTLGSLNNSFSTNTIGTYIENKK